MKKICFFGIYDSNYARNRILISGFRANGYEVVECCIDPKIYKGLKKYLQLYKEFKKLKDENFDIFLVAFPGQTVVWLARILFGKKIIFDAFLSLYDSNVFDRKIYSKYSFMAVKDFILDWYSCFLAEKVLLDTNEHIKYFVETFHISKDKFIRVPIGADESVFYPRTNTYSNKEIFNVHFHGTFIPLQGVEYIIESANILRNEKIHFTLVGFGQEFEIVKNGVKLLGLKKVVSLVGKIPMEKIPEYISKSDVCLGIFGNTEKTKRVIPNKVYECIAMGKPVITAKTEAIEEYFSDNENVTYCNIADSKDLAKKIMLIKSNPELIKKIAESGYNLFQAKFKSDIIVRNILACL